MNFIGATKVTVIYQHYIYLLHISSACPIHSKERFQRGTLSSDWELKLNWGQR